MSIYSYHDILNQAQHLAPDEQLRLLEDLAAIGSSNRKTDRRTSIGSFDHVIRHSKRYGNNL